MEPFNNSITSMDQFDNIYDFQDPVLQSMDHQPPAFNRSSSLTPLLSSWHVNPPSPQKVHVTLKNIYNNNDLSLDSIIDFMDPSSIEQGMHFSPLPHNNHHQQTNPNSPVKSQQDLNANSPLLEEYDVFNTDVPFDFDTWNVLCSNDMYVSSSEPFSCSASETGSDNNRVTQQYISQSQQHEQENAQNLHQSMTHKRKASGGNQNVEVNKKKRVVSRTQQQEKKDIISCVIANLPASVIEEQQKAIPTAFPSRMRQTRIQAALKAQTDAMVQSCQQRIMKNSVDELIAPTTSGQGGESNGEAVQYIGAYTLEERRIRIARFREKRKHRVWDHSVKYNCRRKLAVGRVRVKGRFVKSGEDVQK